MRAIALLAAVAALSGCAVAARDRARADYHQSLVAYRECLATGADCHTLRKVMEANRDAFNDMAAAIHSGTSTSVWVNRD